MIGDVLENTDLDKNQMDDLYEALMSKGIEIVSETEPDDFEILLENDVDITEDPDVMDEAEEIDLKPPFQRESRLTIRCACIWRNRQGAAVVRGRDETCQAYGAGRRGRQNVFVKRISDWLSASPNAMSAEACCS